VVFNSARLRPGRDHVNRSASGSQSSPSLTARISDQRGRRIGRNVAHSSRYRRGDSEAAASRKALQRLDDGERVPLLTRGPHRGVDDVDAQDPAGAALQPPRRRGRAVAGWWVSVGPVCVWNSRASQ
jgi:hypothetical protein